MTSAIRRILHALAAGAGLLVPFGLPAAELRVTVTGVDGSPVAHAAVVLEHDGEPGSTGRRRAVIDQQDKQFAPWVTAVPAGSELVFTNHDDITHHVYSFSPARRFSFRLQAGEKREPMTVPQDGVIVLGCNIHDWMVGYVLVADASAVATTDAGGEARFTLAPGKWRVRVWHPGFGSGESPASREIEIRERPLAVAFRLTAPLTETGPREPLDESGYGSP